jgi:hypothetical protein
MTTTVEPDARRGSASRFPPAAFVGIAIVLLVGLTAVPMSFMGDQALYDLGARAMGRGQLLYRDFWDIAQPGIYVFFRAAGATTGFGNIGVHVLELAWQLALAVLVVFVLRSRVRATWVLAAAPVFAVGTYYAIASTSELTRVETLVGLPILGAIALTLYAVRRPTARVSGWCMAGAGVCAFVIAFFKLLLFLTPLACCALIVVSVARNEERPLRHQLMRRFIVPFVAGGLLAGVACVVWIVSHGLTSEVWHTFIVMPSSLPGRAGRPISRLAASVKQLVKLTAPLLVLAVVGLERARPKHRDLLAQSMVVWILVGTFTYLLQLWWFYQLMLFMVPLGVLATYGLDTLWSNRARVSTAAAVGVVVLLVLSSAFAAKHLGTRVKQLAQNGFAIGATNSAAFRVANNPPYGTVVDQARFLDRFPKRAGVYVWGDPLYLYVSGRTYAISVDGWDPELIDQRLWARAARELAAARPEVVFVDTFSAPYIATRGKTLERWLQANYHVAATVPQGHWYVLNRSH